MAERPRGSDEPDFDWLYGQGAGSDPGYDDRPGDGSGNGYRDGRAPRPARDPEPTQVLPTMGRPGARPGARSAARPGDRPGDRPGGRQGGRPPTRPSGPRPARPSRTPRRRRLWRLLVLLVALWVAFLVAVPIWAWTKIDKVAYAPAGARPADQPGTTYLMVGSDSRAGLTRKQELRLGTGKAEGQRTDTIMLLHVGSGPNLLVSIPRDSWVPIPGHGYGKINSAFAYGGPKLLVKTIEQDTGVRVDDYVEVGFAGFVDVVNAVGGIQICPKTNMKDPLANLDIKKGCQHVNGKTALGYARSRHVSSLGDIDRAAHQREVVSAVGHKAVSPWSVIDPFRYEGLASAGAKSLRVGKGTGPLALVRFAWAMTHVNGKDGLTCGVPISDLYVHWDRPRALRFFHLIEKDETSKIGKHLCSPSGLPQ